MRRLYTLFCVSFICITSLMAQQFVVKDFYHDNKSLVLKKKQNVKYYNGNKEYAIIIMDSPTDDIIFPGKADSLVYKSPNGTLWIYMQGGAKDFKFHPKGYSETTVTFSEKLDTVCLEAGQVYKLIVERPSEKSYPVDPMTSIFERHWHNKDNWSIGIDGKYVSKDLPINLSIHGAYVTNYVPLEIEATLGLKKSSGTYIYDSNGTIKDSYEYTGLRFTARSGYCFEIDKSKRFMITPLGGLSYNVLFGSQIKSASSMQVYADANSSGANTSEARKWGDGGNAISFVGGLRFSYAINEHWLIHAMPEYNVNIWKDNNFNFISKTDDGVKAWSDGFNISIGLIFRWEH